jgi:hypothetical protein
VSERADWLEWRRHGLGGSDIAAVVGLSPWGYLGEWRPVELDHVALILDAIADNERELYPPPAAGNAYVTRFVRVVFRDGWRAARDELHRQRAERASRVTP